MPRDDDDEELPKKKKPKASRPVDDDEDEDDDEEEERPRKKRRRADDDDDDDNDGGNVGGLIPLKNSKALMAYYFAVFSLIPGLGCLLGPIAIVLGFLGFQYAKENPKAGGKGHAVTGMVLGLIGPFLITGLFVVVGYFLNL